MKGINFPQSTGTFGPPPDMCEGQVIPIPCCVQVAAGGSCDGSLLIVTCHQPSEAERQAIAAGAPIFLTCLGCLPPHFLTTTFEQAIRPA